jgi:hypothetical protein
MCVKRQRVIRDGTPGRSQRPLPRPFVADAVLLDRPRSSWQGAWRGRPAPVSRRAAQVSLAIAVDLSCERQTPIDRVGSSEAAARSADAICVADRNAASPGWHSTKNRRYLPPGSLGRTHVRPTLRAYQFQSFPDRAKAPLPADRVAALPWLVAGRLLFAPFPPRDGGTAGP